MFSHINLAVVGLLIKLIHPQTKLLLQAHGIEVWGNQSFIKKLFLKNADFILAVSEFTRNKIIKKHEIEPSKCLIFPNSLDPYFNIIANPELKKSLKSKYHIQNEHQVLITLTRLASSEKYKGYDKVIHALYQLHKKGKKFKYLILGKYDPLEFERISQLINSLNLQNQVILCDFIEDHEISSYFELADVFIMPSQKEGFGIVFIEAMACGLPVIAGNLDGSVDALKNGTLGTLINPNDENAIINAIENFKSHPLSSDKELLKSQIQQSFGYPSYRKKLEKLLLQS
jgi:glycosyltransferase involved in cell wall biosynthesis